MSKFAVYSDLHLHNWAYATRTNEGINERLKQQYNFLITLSTYCTVNKIKPLFFCGDFFHTHGKIATDVMHAGYGAISNFYRSNIEHYMLIGNHDIARTFDQFPYVPNSLSPFADKARVIDTPIIGGFIPIESSREGGYYISMLPFIEEVGILKSWLNKVKQFNTNCPHYLFLHQGVSGAPIGSGYLLNEILSIDMIPENVTRAFTGHYHTHRDLGKLVIVGPPMQHTWADKNEEGGILVVDSETGKLERVQIYANPKFVELSADFLALAVNLEIPIDLIRNNIIRVIGIRCDLDVAERAKQAMLKMGALAVELKFEDRNLEVPVISKALSIEEIITEFSRKLSDREIAVGEELRKNSYEVPST